VKNDFGLELDLPVEDGPAALASAAD
jgi:hypothetical protein